MGDKEIHRQNQITARIVANYIERRLFPFKRPTHRLPTVDEILPAAKTQNISESKTKRNLSFIDDEDVSDDYFTDYEPEELQFSQTNHVDSFYSEMNGNDNNESEGRFHFFKLTFPKNTQKFLVVTFTEKDNFVILSTINFNTGETIFLRNF